MSIAKNSLSLFETSLENNKFCNVIFENERGRCLKSRKQITPKSDVILMEEDCIVSIMHPDPQGACHYCFKANSAELSRCSKCRFAFYCNRDCQKADFKTHKVECGAVCSIEHADKVPLERMLLASRLVFWMIKHHEKQDDRMKRLMSLNTHADKLTDKAIHHLNMQASFVNKLLQLQQAPDMRYVSVPFVTSILSMLNVNLIGITEEKELSTIGQALYLNHSLINHSCQPNCTISFSKTKAILRALKPIEEDEEITISYVDFLTARKSRKQTLFDTYHFDCNCQRCLAPPNEDLYERPYLCQCGGKAVFSDELINSNSTTTTTTTSSSSTSSTIANINVNCLKCKTSFTPRMKSDQLEQLHPSALVFYRLLQSKQTENLQAALRGEEPIQKTLTSALQLLKYLENIIGNSLSTNHPLLLKQNFFVGRIAMECNDASTAIKHLRIAGEMSGLIGVPSSQFRSEIYKLIMEAESFIRHTT